MSRTTLPIDLIVAQHMHDMYSRLPAFRVAVKLAAAGAPSLDDLHTEMARNLLCTIAHHAHLPKVFEALAAVGAPASLEDVREGLKAVEDTMP